MILVKPLPAVCRLDCIATPSVRRDKHVRNQKFMQKRDPRHPLYDHNEIRRRLKSRSILLIYERLDPDQRETYRLDKWRHQKAYTNNTIQEPTEKLSECTDLPRRE